jgi:predicted metal-dependent enzyme (double-stranded beta helix superfamily)
MNAISDAQIDTLIDEAKGILAREGETRLSLEKVLKIVLRIAALPARWDDEHYSVPPADEHQARYLIRTDPDDRFTLYLNVMRPGKRIPPHNHTTWACIASVEGAEHNVIYERTDGGHGSGPAVLAAVGEVEIRPGEGLALLADDIHSVEIRGERPIRHLHFYGRALETLSERLMFDIETGEARPMKMTVATKR